jgi:hypothetical protein
MFVSQWIRSGCSGCEQLRRSSTMLHRNLPYPNTAGPRASTTRLHTDPQQSESSKLCHRGNLTKTPISTHVSNCDTLCHTSGRLHTDVSGLQSTLAGSGARTRDPLMQGERLLPSFAHRSLSFPVRHTTPTYRPRTNKAKKARLPTTTIFLRRSPYAMRSSRGVCQAQQVISMVSGRRVCVLHVARPR